MYRIRRVLSERATLVAERHMQLYFSYVCDGIEMCRRTEEGICEEQQVSEQLKIKVYVSTGKGTSDLSLSELAP